MDRKANEKGNRGYFMRKAKQKARPIVERRRQQLAKRGIELTREEENKIIEKVAKKIKREVAVRGFFTAMGISLGIGAGATGMKLLNEAQNKGITQTEDAINIDVLEAGKDININVENKDENNKYNVRQIFLNDVRVDLDKQENEIKQNIKEDLEKLSTKEDVLKYIKNFCLDEYNRNNGTQLTEKNIFIHKKIYNISIMEDKANNGDDILRSKYSGSDNYEKGVYTVEIKTEEGSEKQTIARNFDNKCVRVYNDDEEVEKYSENEASMLGDVIASGVDYAISMEEDNSIDVDDTYTDRLVNAISEYKNKKIDRIISGEEYNKTNTDINQERE